MNEINKLLDQMTVDIFQQALRLDDVRLSLFLNWLNSHSSTMQSTVVLRQIMIQMDGALLRKEGFETALKSSLKTWFESLPIQGLLWEYHLILDEIAWWHSLDGYCLNMILKSEAGK